MSRRIYFLKILVICLLLIMTVFSINISVMGSGTIKNVEILSEDSLPEELNFKVKNECTHHSFFEYATAQDDGAFATYTSGVVVNDVRVDTTKKFVDIYDVNGEFVNEISFETSSDVAIELTKTTLNMYMYSSVICYNLKTGNVNYYITPDYEAYNSGFARSLQKNKFTVGEWTYVCKGGNLLGHTQLIRTNGNSTQTLIEMEGTQNPNIVHALIGAVIIASVPMFVWFIKFKQKKKKPIRGRFYD